MAGGFAETNKGLATYGYTIKCPGCGAAAASDFAAGAWQDKKLGSVEYHCSSCGTEFVCYDGYVVFKDAWVELCGRKGYEYPFV